MARSAIGFIAGAAFMYFADPGRGRRRRAVARDKFMRRTRDVTGELDKARRDLGNRASGFKSAVTSLWKRPATDDVVLAERVRTRIGRAVSHPHAIKARISGNGRVVLEGPVLRHELDYLLKSVRGVRGVKQVVTELDVYAEPGGVASLQGGENRRELSEFAQENWTPALRVATGAVGSAVLLGGFGVRGPLRWVSAAGGAALLARAVANQPLAQFFGLGQGSGAVHFDKTIHIDAPAEQVYGYWSNFANFPLFMTHLKEVRPLADGSYHWVAAGPGGVSIPWDAKVTEQRPNQLLAWSSVPGSVVRTSGSVRFDKEGDHKTRVTVRMSYCPPAGIVGHAVALLFGTDPKTEMDDDLVRMKSLLEDGKTRAHGASVTRDQVPATPVGSAGT